MKFAGRENLLKALNSEAHVWLALPENYLDSRWQGFFRGILSEDEIERYKRLRFPADRHLYLVSHALIRMVLSKYFDLAPEQWRFFRNRYGRPEIDPSLGFPSLRFNLSHTQGLVSCLVVISMDAGVDCENHSGLRDLDVLAEDVLSISEKSCLNGLGDEEKKRRFITYWTLKEAFLKGMGTGFTCPMSQISFHLKTEEAISVSFDSDLKGNRLDWQFDHFRPTTDHSLAIALCRGDKNDLKIKFWQLLPGPSDLLTTSVEMER